MCVCVLFSLWAAWLKNFEAFFPSSLFPLTNPPPSPNRHQKTLYPQPAKTKTPREYHPIQGSVRRGEQRRTERNGMVELEIKPSNLNRRLYVCILRDRYRYSISNRRCIRSGDSSAPVPVPFLAEKQTANSNIQLPLSPLSPLPRSHPRSPPPPTLPSKITSSPPSSPPPSANTAHKTSPPRVQPSLPAARKPCIYTSLLAPYSHAPAPAPASSSPPSSLEVD